MTINKHPKAIWLSVIIAVVFGLVTIKAGGSVLFIDGEARQAAGNYVDFVLWFNFFAGFFYVITGIAIYFKKAWATKAAISIATLTVVVFAAFGLHIFNGGGYEQRTVYAMTLRSLIWIGIAFACWRRSLPQFDI